MIKKIILVLIMVSMVVVFGACSNKVSKVDATVPAKTEGSAPEVSGKLEEIKSNGKILLGTSAGYPPFEFHKLIDGVDHIVGLDIEMAKKIAEEIGVELEIIDMKFEGLLPALVTDDIDFIIAGMVAKPERAEVVDFSIPYYQAEHKMLVNIANKDKIKHKEDLAVLNVGAQKATTQEALILEELTVGNYIGISKVPDLVLELQNNKIDVVVMAEPVALAYVSQNDNLYMAEESLGVEPGLAIAVNKGNADLLELINKVVDEMIKAGEIHKLMKEATELAK